MARIKKMVILAISVLAILISCAHETVFHIVTYDTGGMIYIPSATIADGDTLGKGRLPTLSDKGTTKFDGWYLDGAKINPDYRVRKDITLTAVWNENSKESGKVMLSYATSYGTPPCRIIIDQDSSLTSDMLASPTGSELMFDGWYLNEWRGRCCRRQPYPGRYHFGGKVERRQWRA